MKNLGMAFDVAGKRRWPRALIPTLTTMKPSRRHVELGSGKPATAPVTGARRCDLFLRMRAKISAAHETSEAAIVEQMGDMEVYLRAVENTSPEDQPK